MMGTIFLICLFSCYWQESTTLHETEGCYFMDVSATAR